MAQIMQSQIRDLKPNPRNARTHSKKQIHQIAEAIRRFGFNNPILVDQFGVILAGHGRVEAAKLLQHATVPTIQIEHLSEAEKRAYVIADNKLALNAGWDPDILAIEICELSELDLDFDIEITGFQTAEIDNIVEVAAKSTSADKADEIPPIGSSIVTELGDIWVLGIHKIMCADARSRSTLTALMGEDRARMMFSDAPYNVPIAGHVGGLGAIKHREFAMAAGEMTPAQFTGFLKAVFEGAASVSLDGAIHFACMDWRHIGEILKAGSSVYSELKNLCVWNKNNGGMGSFYRSKHELVFVFKVGTAPHLNTIELGRSGRYRTNVWDYAGANTLSDHRIADLAMHPTVKPVAMVVDAIKDCSRRNDVILDPFGGSGTTLIAAHKTRRRARLMEIDPAYVDVTIRRWEKLCGQEAIHEESGLTFMEMSHQRRQKIAGEV